MFSKRSLEKLATVHPDLQKIANIAIATSPVDFGVTMGIRTPEEQARFILNGTSQRKISRHLTGHAIDILAYENGEAQWKARKLYEQIAEAMLASAESLNIPIIWGGGWKSLDDVYHFELDEKAYPVSEKDKLALLYKVNNALTRGGA